MVAQEKKTSDAEYATMLSNRREARARVKAGKLAARLDELAPSTLHRTADEWAALSRQARWKASQRDRECLLHLLSKFRASEIASVLATLGIQEGIFDSPELFQIYYVRVQAIVDRLESADYGVPLALYLYYEQHMTLPKILQVTQAACKRYMRGSDSYEAKQLLVHRFLKGQFIKVPTPS